MGAKTNFLWNSLNPFFKFLKVNLGLGGRSNALVICNHGSPPLGNSWDFDFFPSKSLLEAPHCGDKQMVKSLLNSPTLLGSGRWSSPDFRYIPFPLALICLSEVTILTFTVISAMVQTAQKILGQILFICISSHN